MKIIRNIMLTGLICEKCIDAYSINPADSIAADSILCNELMEVTVTAERPASTLRADKVSYYPSAMIIPNMSLIIPLNCLRIDRILTHMKD